MSILFEFCFYKSNERSEDSYIGLAGFFVLFKKILKY